MPKKRKTKDPDRVTLCTLAGRIIAYRRVNKEADAKRWAHALVLQLMEMGLINARNLSPHEFVVDLRSPETITEKNGLGIDTPRIIGP